MALMTDSLHRFDLKQSDDPVKTDLELTCSDCGEVLCDVEADDNLQVLAQTADAHECDEENEHGLVGMQVERYEALVEHVGHDAALADARKWPEVGE